jgi:hypothetical protein
MIGFSFTLIGSFAVPAFANHTTIAESDAIYSRFDKGNCYIHKEVRHFLHIGYTPKSVICNQTPPVNFRKISLDDVRINYLLWIEIYSEPPTPDFLNIVYNALGI